MDGVTAEDWLAQDMRDDLDCGPVGLYEFIWTLHGSSYDLPEPEAIELSRRIARRFVDDGLADIFAVTWPHHEIVRGPLSPDVLDDPATWAIGDAGPFLALIPTDMEIDAAG